MSFVLTLKCTDSTGIVAAVTTALAGRDGFILESQQYADLDSRQFFMRVEFTARNAGLSEFERLLSPIVAEFGMDLTLVDSDQPMRIVIAVSRFGHCLNDLLHRWRTATLPVEIVAVVSNHDDLRALTEWHGVAFHHLPVATGNRAAQEAALLKVVDDSRAELLVLARYMQVLSTGLCDTLSGRCINIHHSFLPSFAGAKPYHQAHARGVKLIGATAHYVTPDLDEGPIIEQAAHRVDHAMSADAMVTAGRDVESAVLARAVGWAGERRILTNGNSTVVFRR